jgi:DNA-binding NtrC family response regulator
VRRWQACEAHEPPHASSIAAHPVKWRSRATLRVLACWWSTTSRAYCAPSRRISGAKIVVLSAREAERDKVNALDLGADDYLTERFGVNELLAQVRVALRTQHGHPLELIR